MRGLGLLSIGRVYSKQMRVIFTQWGLYSVASKCIGRIEFVSQVAHDRDTYATSNISP